MAHFARIDENNIVQEVLVVPNEQEHRGEEFLSKDLGLGGRWIQTSYNRNFRIHYAGIGYSYDEQKDAFIPYQPFPSWIFDEKELNWKAPKDKPSDYAWWNEEVLDWVVE